jgi:predicted membrane protein
MENTENKTTDLQEEMWKNLEEQHRRGKIVGGIAIVVAGSLFLARELGVLFPPWFFTWKIALIAFGVFGFLKHGFHRLGWLIPILVGGAFLHSDLYPEMATKPLLWPILVIIFGLVVIFKPRKKHNHLRWKKWQKHRHFKEQYYKESCATDCDNSVASSTSEDIIDTVSIMSGVKKNVLSKTFKSGDIVVVMAGAELNFSQADFNETATLEITAVLGGVKLIIPANWETKSELVCIMGNVEDKRAIQPSVVGGAKKVLVLTGNVIMGGIEIRNY